MEKIAQLSAPAKAILCGQHAVVYGQNAIAFAINLKCKALVFRINNQNVQNQGSINLKLKLNNQLKTVNYTSSIFKASQQIVKINQKLQINDLKLKNVQISYQCFCQTLIKQNLIKSKQNQLIFTTLYKISIFFNLFDHIFTLKQNYLIQTQSQIPIGKGLGSSASFNTILTSSLLVICNIIDSNKIKNSNYKILVNHVSKIFQQIQHGKPSGIDNFVSVYGGLVLFNKTKNPPFKLIENPLILQRLNKLFTFGFIDSKIEKNTKKAVSNVLGKYNQYKNGQFKFKNMIQQIGTFSNKIIEILQNQNIQEKQIKDMFFSILSLNHNHLKDLGLSNQKLQQIVNKLTVKDLCTSKITGSGMGGVILVVGAKQYMNTLRQTQKQNQDQIIICGMNTFGLQIHFYSNK